LTAQSAEETLKRAQLIGESAHVAMTVQMSIRTQGGVKERSLEIYIQEAEEATRVLVQVVEPAFLRNMKFLEHRYPDGREDKWLKTSRGVRRLSQANRSERLFDSDFTVEDLSRIDVEDFRLFFASGDTAAGERTIVAEPVGPAGEYARKEFTIDLRTNLVTRVDYIDANGKLSRRYTLLETRSIEGEVFPWRCRMEDFRGGSSTTLLFRRIALAEPLPARLFNKASL
jgi:hypothetical protein